MMLKIFNYFHLMIRLLWAPVESIPLIFADYYTGSE